MQAIGFLHMGSEECIFKMFTAGVFVAAAKFSGTELHVGSGRLRLGVIIQLMGSRSAVILELDWWLQTRRSRVNGIVTRQPN
jgi:hypothetical protein